MVLNLSEELVDELVVLAQDRDLEASPFVYFVVDEFQQFKAQVTIAIESQVIRKKANYIIMIY